MFWKERIVCRLCLLSGLNADFFEVLLESDDTEMSPLASKIFSALKWEVRREDGLPNFVCQECIQRLNFIIFCNTWSSRVAMDFEEIQSLFSLYCKQDDNAARSVLISRFQIRNGAENDKTLVSSKFDTIISLVSQMENLLCKTEMTNFCFDESEKKTVALELPIWSSPQDVGQYCTSPVVDETQHQQTSNELNAGAEDFWDLKLTSSPEEISNQLADEFSTASGKNSKASDKQFLCPECQFPFPQRNYLWKHLMTHEGALNKYQCSICRRKLISTSELNRHIRAHKGLKPYGCTKCDQFFSQKNLLDNHVNWHDGRKGHLCDICGECLSSGPNLKAHILNKHSLVKKKPFECAECGKCFARSHHLENHIIIHKKCRPHLCTTCGISFKRASQLQEHENVHSGEKNHKCDECNKSFRTKRVLNVHKLVHSELKPHQCSQCSKSFVRRGGLLTHLKAHKN